jgi:hypothetical protein
MTAHTRTDDEFPERISNAPSTRIEAATSPALLAQLDTLRFAAGEADVLASVTVEWFDRRGWGDADPMQIERLAYLLGLIAKASTAVAAAVASFHSALADVQPAEVGDEWDSQNG